MLNNVNDVKPIYWPTQTSTPPPIIYIIANSIFTPKLLCVHNIQWFCIVIVYREHETCSQCTCRAHTLKTSRCIRLHWISRFEYEMFLRENLDFCLQLSSFTFASLVGLFPTPSPPLSPDAVCAFCSSIVCKLGFSMTSFCVGFRNYTPTYK